VDRRTIIPNHQKCGCWQSAPDKIEIQEVLLAIDDQALLLLKVLSEVSDILDSTVHHRFQLDEARFLVSKDNRIRFVSPARFDIEFSTSVQKRMKPDEVLWVGIRLSKNDNAWVIDYSLDAWDEHVSTEQHEMVSDSLEFLQSVSPGFLDFLRKNEYHFIAFCDQSKSCSTRQNV
jgi:hypothetical protein